MRQGEGRGRAAVDMGGENSERTVFGAPLGPQQQVWGGMGGWGAVQQALRSEDT